MHRATIRRVSAVTPVIMSLAACAIVLVVVATGRQPHDADEGTAAHLFQLLVVLQLPVIVTFVAIARRRGVSAIAKPLACQIGALGLALALVAHFHL